MENQGLEWKCLLSLSSLSVLQEWSVSMLQLSELVIFEMRDRRADTCVDPRRLFTRDVEVVTFRSHAELIMSPNTS